ncbi:propanediol utilization microcompartment protein PduB, partial [Yersinia enterocolitica]
MKSNDLVDQIMAQVIAKVSEHAPASSAQPS